MLKLCTNRWLIALVITLVIIAALGIPFTHWGFKTDDWANILHSKLSSWQEVFTLFTEGNMERFNHPSGSTVEADTGSFLSGLYRPLSFIYYYPQTLLFDTQAYGYFLTTIIFHALNAGLFFIVLSNFFNITISSLAALLFGFHPSLQNWLGWISAQTYFIEFFIFGLIFIFFYRWLQTKQWHWYIAAATLFLCNLFLKESGIIFPAWAFLATLAYSKKITYQSVILAAQSTLGFFSAAGIYCLARLTCMPFITTTTGTLGFALTWQSFIAKQCARGMQLLTYVYDIFGLTWLPRGNRWINGLLLLLVIATMFFLFIKSKNKRNILFCFISTLIFSWPGLLIHYQPRYMYLALPWAIISFILLLQEITLSTQSKKFLFACSLAGIAASGSYVFTNMKEREHALHWLDTSMRNLVTQDLPAAGWQREPLYFFGLPAQWFDMGTAQAVWLLDHAATNSFPVYHFGASLNMPTQNHARAIPLIPNAGVITTITGSTIFLSIKKIDLLAITNTSQDYMRLTIPDGLRQHALWLITWDYEQAKFKIMQKLKVH